MGFIKITRYQSNNLITPLVNDIIKAPLRGSTCVLTKTNDEASQIAGVLQKRGIRSRLIQSNDGFSLYNLYELRFFLNTLQLEADSVVVSDESWATAKKELTTKFKNSSKLEIVKTLIADFEASCGRRKFKSDLEVFIRESKLEDFYSGDVETIYVSTIHKSKGREFDNVFLMLNGVPSVTDDEVRPIYVALTRAKNFLSIHTNGMECHGIRSNGLIETEDAMQYSEPSDLTVELTLKDVWLDFFISRQHLYNNLISGSPLAVKNDRCSRTEEYLLRFSKTYRDTIRDLEQKGYSLKEAKVNFILYWRKEGADVECKIVIPELSFQRQ